MHPKCAIRQGESGVPGALETAGRAVAVARHMPAPGCVELEWTLGQKILPWGITEMEQF